MLPLFGRWTRQGNRLKKLIIIARTVFLMTSSTIEGLQIILFGPGGYVFAGIMGALVGSFVNVVAIRLPKGLSIVKPPSHCMSCETPIAFYDNIPILSYIILRGKCRRCGVRFSPFYAAVELIMAILGILCFFHSRALVKSDPLLLSAQFFTALSFCGVMVAITLIDLKTWIIPNVITYPSLFFFWGATVSLGRVHWGDALAGAGFGFGSLGVVILGYKWLTGRDGMGWGDAKLLAVAGAFLGWQVLPTIIFLAAFQGLLAAMILIVTKKSLDPRESYVPLENIENNVEQKANDEVHDGTDAHHTQKATAVSEHDGRNKGGHENNEYEKADAEHERTESWRHVAMPFGPFLALATLEALFLNSWLINIIYKIY